MIFEISFILVGGMNLGLEHSWAFIKSLLDKYPYAKWKKVINKKKKKGKYIIEIN